MTACPCCKAAVPVPALDDLIAAHWLEPVEASILRAVWRGKGHPVQTDMIFDEVYADDPDGGPSPTRMYAVFNKAILRLNSRLSSAGVAIRSVGYRKGYRLSLGGNGG